MKKNLKATLDIYQNVNRLKEPLDLTADLVEFFSDGFNEVMAHDDSVGTRKRLRTVRAALLKDLDEVFRVLSAIDPDLVLEWKLGHCDFEETDS